MNRCWPLQMPPTQKSVLMAIAHLADDAGDCVPTLADLRGLTCFERNALIDSVKWLEQRGAILAARSPGRPTQFTVQPHAFIALDPVDESDWESAPQPASTPVAQTNGSVAPPRRRADRLPCPIQRIVDGYHELMPRAPRVMRMTDVRERAIRARWREFAEEKGWTGDDEGVEFFRRYFAHCAQSRFLTGRVEAQNGRPPFVADLEWLMRPTNLAKVIEGWYHRA